MAAPGHLGAVRLVAALEDGGALQWGPSLTPRDRMMLVIRALWKGARIPHLPVALERATGGWLDDAANRNFAPFFELTEQKPAQVVIMIT